MGDTEEVDAGTIAWEVRGTCVQRAIATDNRQSTQARNGLVRGSHQYVKTPWPETRGLFVNLKNLANF